ncbi:MAG: fasciclin domain-containing protein [Aquabacterium sp.]
MTMRHIPTRALSAAVIVAATLMTGCASVKNSPVTAAGSLAQQADLSTFNKLAAQAGLSDVLNGASPVTVFAPTNEAFAAVPAATLDKLAKDPAQLKAVLSYHIVAGSVMAVDVKENTQLPTVGGVKLAVSKAGDFITIDEAMVTEGDIKTANGIIHKIDRVLTPPAPKK